MKQERGETGKRNKENHPADTNNQQDLAKKSSEAQPDDRRRPDHGRTRTSRDPLGLTDCAEIYRHGRMPHAWGLLPPPTESRQPHKPQEDEASENPLEKESSWSPQEKEANDLPDSRGFVPLFPPMCRDPFLPLHWANSIGHATHTLSQLMKLVS